MLERQSFNVHVCSMLLQLQFLAAPEYLYFLKVKAPKLSKLYVMYLFDIDMHSWPIYL